MRRLLTALAILLLATCTGCVTATGVMRNVLASGPNSDMAHGGMPSPPPEEMLR